MEGIVLYEGVPFNKGWGGRRFTLRGFKQNLKKSDTFFPREPPLFPQLKLLIIIKKFQIQVNLDMTDSMGPGKLVRHMQNPSYTYDKYLICIRLGPSMLSVICKNLSYSGPSYQSSPVVVI